MSDNLIINTVEKILEDNFGRAVAERYIRFYSDKSPEAIFNSVEELLVEMVGPVNAEKQIRSLSELVKK